MLYICGFTPLVTMSATIWNGPLTSYSQPLPYPNPPNDRDQLTPDVALTRADPSAGSGTGGIFNAVTETSFTKFVSPAGTGWAVGSLSNYATLTYTDWLTASGGSPVRGSLTGKQFVVHLISDDIYLSIEFTSFPAGPGFSYNRSTPAVANNPPSLAITNPPPGAVFAAPANVAIQAAATNGSGTVTNVQFLVGSAVLTNETAAPFAATAANLAAGSYPLSAIATDNNGMSATSSVSVSVVNPVPINLTSPMRLSSSNFQFNYSANVGLQYVVQRSANLLATNWLGVATNTAAASSMSFTDTTATASPEFYRVARLPNL